MRHALPFLLLAAAAAPLAAQRRPAPLPAITPAEIDAHLRFLSSDLLEGRAPATRGGELAAAYIAAQLAQYGYEPGANGSFFQRVPIDVVAANRATIRVEARGKANAALRDMDDVVVWAGSAAERSAAQADLVFVGYGIAAPEYGWDDYKNRDVRGKIVLILVNDPPAPADEPGLFGGKAMTYYGRWTYKFEEAERRGAAGALLVHTTLSAGYGWPTVVGSWAKEQRMLPRDPKLPPPLAFRGWITSQAAARLLGEAGLDLAGLAKAAQSRSFDPVPTGITLDVAFANTVQHLESANVIGVLPGTDPARRREHVVFTAHWDHLGIGPVVDGDSIYNGASDNASGVADLLAVARAAAAAPRPARSLLFNFVTAEESGLLGSEYFAANPTVPLDQVVAGLNVDGGNLRGETRDLVLLGEQKSTLGAFVSARAKARGLRLSPEEFPERGSFYRSDHFSLAKAGVPAVSVGAGADFVGRPAGWGREQIDEFTTKHYHQPSDEYRADFDLRGAAQLAGVVLDAGLALANSREWPRWSPGAEFRRSAPVP